MRIAVIVRRFPTASQTFVTDQLAGLVALGHEVEVYPERQRRPGDDHPLLRDPRVSVHYPRPSGRRMLTSFAGDVARHPRAMFTAARAAVQTLGVRVPHGREYDVVQCHFGTGGLRGVAMRRQGQLRGPVATVFHGADLTRVVHEQGPRIYDTLFAEGDLFQPVTDYFAQVLRDLGCPADRIVVQRMGVDVRRFAFRQRHLAHGERAEIVSIGRMVEKKGFEYAVRAVARLTRWHGRLRYTIIGDGELRPALERLVQDLQLGDVVRLVGWRGPHELPAMLDEAHLLVAPSVTAGDGDQEGLPVVLMEALASGLLVVSTRHSGIPELVRHWDTGLLVEERDVAGLADAIAALLDSPDRWAALGEAGRRRVEREHDQQALTRRLADTYQRLASGNSQRR